MTSFDFFSLKWQVRIFKNKTIFLLLYFPISLWWFPYRSWCFYYFVQDDDLHLREEIDRQMYEEVFSKHEKIKIPWFFGSENWKLPSAVHVLHKKFILHTKDNYSKCPFINPYVSVSMNIFNWLLNWLAQSDRSAQSFLHTTIEESFRSAPFILHHAESHLGFPLPIK